MVHKTAGLPLSNFIPFKTSQHEKLPRTNQRARQESHTTNQNCTVKNRLYMFSEWNEFFKRQWSAALIIQYRGENVYKTGSSLVAKDETLKKNSEKLSFIGKWPNYSPSTNLSTQNSIVRLCINWNFFFDLLFTRHYNDLKELFWISKISSDSHHNYNQSSNELEHNLLIVKFSKNACKTHSTLLFKLNLPNCSIF